MKNKEKAQVLVELIERYGNNINIFTVLEFHGWLMNQPDCGISELKIPTGFTHYNPSMRNLIKPNDIVQVVDDKGNITPNIGKRADHFSSVDGDWWQNGKIVAFKILKPQNAPNEIWFNLALYPPQEWAQYRAIDVDGSVHDFEKKPVLQEGYWQILDEKGILDSDWIWEYVGSFAPPNRFTKNENGLCVNIRELKNKQNSRKLESAWKQV